MSRKGQQPRRSSFLGAPGRSVQPALLPPTFHTDDEIIGLILRHEGSTYTNDPHDAGGPTKYGITWAVLSAWRGRPCTAADVQGLTRAEAVAIYMAQYIRPFDRLVEPLRINVIDMAVNAGVRRATFLLQKMVGVTVDGWIGPTTIAAVNNLEGLDRWNTIYVGFRLAWYEDLIVADPVNIKWRNGWRFRALSFLPLAPGLRAIAVHGPMAKAA